MNLSYRLRKEFAHKLAVAKAGTQFVDEKEIGDGKVLTYNAKKKDLEYTTPSTGGGTGDMTKAVYDTNNDGIVENAAVAATATDSLKIASNLSDVAVRQTALNTLTAATAATNEHVLTKDTGTGNAVFKVSAAGGYTDEQAQDAVGTILTDTATIDFTYTDATPTIEASVKAASITEAMQVLADNTTNDVSTSKHGYVPKAPNDTAKFLRGDATWAALVLTLAVISFTTAVLLDVTPAQPTTTVTFT
jgi:hypothetical protein